MIVTMTTSPEQTTASIIHMLNTRGQGDYIGEAISQLAHALQAAQLAKEHTADEDTIIAALLHDIGHFIPAPELRTIAHEIRNMTSGDAGDTGGIGRVGHERIGEQYLRQLGFSEKVVGLVGSHVHAKRYLCATDPAYHDTLSDASKKSLVIQGGPMVAPEVEEWSAVSWCDDMCQLRKWDDAAKVVGLEVAPADAYGPMIVRHLSRQNEQ
nr:uncharacterized protein CFP56_26081 [Quercus suber]